MFARTPEWWKTRTILDAEWRRQGAGDLAAMALEAGARWPATATSCSRSRTRCHWNEGRWTSRGERTRAEPELRLDVRELGSVYLGGFTFGQLARAGRVEELVPGAIAQADALFVTDRAPWCPEIF